MAKITRKPRKKAPKRATSLRRISTRRLAHARVAGDALRVSFDLVDVSGQPIHDPETFFTFRRLSDNRQIGDQHELELAGTPAVFDLPVATGEVAVCEIDPKRFRFARSPVFFRTPGPPISRQCPLLREPKEWRPQFTRWDDLAVAFDDLKRVLRESHEVTLFDDDEPLADLLTGGAYDDISGERGTLAKTALLNSYFRLNRTLEPISASETWFSFVLRLIAIGRERFLAFVKPEMESLIRNIDEHIELFHADYERTLAANHRGNVPAALQGRIKSMVSIKSTHSKGNFQLTLTHLSDPAEVLLDADIDENGDLLAHFLDLFRHKITGGTHPNDIHELLVIQEGKTQGFDLGYRLV